jgi:7-carboxy-7-deazaguanine synthase (Cx14CxxC type)
MTYSVKELFYTLQGEGAQTGRASVFCRFTGCNLWSGLEKDRHKSICPFCDTDFVGVDGEGGGKFPNAQALAERIIQTWPGTKTTRTKPYVVFTGGEPLLQLDEELISHLHEAGFEVAVETNGTILAPKGIDWLCVSPKQGDKLLQCSGDELKLLFPLKNMPPSAFESLDFQHFFLQAIDEGDAINHLSEVIQYCLDNPQWRISLQTHKLLGLK